jgi:hypothetical protein
MNAKSQLKSSIKMILKYRSLYSADKLFMFKNELNLLSAAYNEIGVIFEFCMLNT